MINGFEKETQPLDEYEKNYLLPIVLKGLKKKTHESLAVTNQVMIEALKQRGYKVTPARLRKIINFIRCQGLIRNLVASSKGYWIESDSIRRQKYKQSIKQRAEAMMSILLYIDN